MSPFIVQKTGILQDRRRRYEKKNYYSRILSFVMTVTAVLPTAVFAAEPQNDLTYAEMFKSLYDDVITNGRTNGYFSAPKNN